VAAKILQAFAHFVRIFLTNANCRFITEVMFQRPWLTDYPIYFININPRTAKPILQRANHCAVCTGTEPHSKLGTPLREYGGWTYADTVGHQKSTCTKDSLSSDEGTVFLSNNVLLPLSVNHHRDGRTDCYGSIREPIFGCLL